MEQKVIYYLYYETISGTIFSALLRPAVLCEFNRDYSLQRARIFKDSGGLMIKDYFLDKKTHVRKSYWQTTDGYNKWQLNESTSEYLKFRAEYHHAHRINEKLEGPFEGSLND